MRPKVRKLFGFSKHLQRAFELRPFRVLCPYCSKEQSVVWYNRWRKPQFRPKVVSMDGRWMWKCWECKLWFFYSPFIWSDGRKKGKDEVPVEVRRLY